MPNQYEPALHTAASIYILQDLCYLHIFQMARNIQKFVSLDELSLT